MIQSDKDAEFRLQIYNIHPDLEKAKAAYAWILGADSNTRQQHQ